MKNKIYSVLVSLVVIPLFAIGQLIGLFIGNLFGWFQSAWFGGSLFFELTPYFISGGVAGAISGFAVIKFYKKYILSFAMIIPSLMTLIVLYYVFTQIGMEGWSFAKLKDLVQQIATIGVYYYALNEGDDFIRGS